MKFKSFAFILFAVIQVLLTLRYTFDITNICILIVNILLTLSFSKKFDSIKDNIASIFLFVYIVCSTHVIALFQMSEIEYKFSDYDFCNLAIFGNKILFVFLLSYNIFGLTNKKNESIGYWPFDYVNIPNSMFYLVMLIAYGISLLSGYLGIGKMGSEAGIVLPFHLNGLFQLFRTSLMPFLIMIYVYHCLSRGIRINRSKIILVVLWGLVEVFVRLSKGALLQTCLPTALLLVIGGFFPAKKLIRLFVPILVIFLFLYPIIEVMRHGDARVSLGAFVQARKSVNSNNEDTHSPYLRIFMTGNSYMNAVPYVSGDNGLFDFNRFPIIFKMGGSAAYTTFVIDGYDYGVHHSSGTTGFVDALLIGGYGTCYLVVVLLTLLGIYIDSNKIRGNPLLRILLLVVFSRTFVMSKTITAFIDSIALPFVLCTMIELVIILHYIKSYYTKSYIS